MSIAGIPGEMANYPYLHYITLQSPFSYIFSYWNVVVTESRRSMRRFPNGVSRSPAYLISSISDAKYRTDGMHVTQKSLLLLFPYCCRYCWRHHSPSLRPRYRTGQNCYISTSCLTSVCSQGSIVFSIIISTQFRKSPLGLARLK